MADAQCVDILLNALTFSRTITNADMDMIIARDGNGIRNGVRSIATILDDAAIHDILVICADK